MEMAGDTLQKALRINLDPRWYGTVAEIGAGQEVARWFFRAGGAAGIGGSGGMGGVGRMLASTLLQVSAPSSFLMDTITPTRFWRTAVSARPTFSTRSFTAASHSR